MKHLSTLRNGIAAVITPTLATSFLLAVPTVRQAQAQTVFSDSFAPAPSALWSNTSGNWTAISGDYFAQAPNNNPIATTFLPFDLANAKLVLTVTVNSLGDGGICLDSDGTTQNGLLLVLGGQNYGQGGRGPGAGESIYWQTVQGGVYGSEQNLVSNVFTTGSNYTITVVSNNNSFSAYVDPNGVFDGSSTLLTDFTSSPFSGGEVGLYDDQPNTTSGAGFGAPTSFSNLSLSGNAAAPEPASLAFLGIAALPLAGMIGRRKRSRRVAPARMG